MTSDVMEYAPSLSPDRQLEHDIQFASLRREECLRNKYEGLANVWAKNLKLLTAFRSRMQAEKQAEKQAEIIEQDGDSA